MAQTKTPAETPTSDPASQQGDATRDGSNPTRHNGTAPSDGRPANECGYDLDSALVPRR
ncbi:MAG: hypothetical protein LC793_21410 [Thermomicrobia bacterium]|nr:hypothetical protein [Thermomicrobia bacterium]